MRKSKRQELKIASLDRQLVRETRRTERLTNEITDLNFRLTFLENFVDKNIMSFKGGTKGEG
jgi:hypothetical protein